MHYAIEFTRLADNASRKRPRSVQYVPAIEELYLGHRRITYNLSYSGVPVL